MASHLEFAQWVPFPLDSVFAFFSNPENLPKVMPAANDTKLLKLDRVPAAETATGTGTAAGVGSTMVTSFRIVPFLKIRKQWTARITDFEWNHHFVDVQDSGPFQSWRHRHEFEARRRDDVAGTLIRDVIDYEVGLGLLGRLADALFVRRQIQHAFAERQRRLPALLGRFS